MAVAGVMLPICTLIMVRRKRKAGRLLKRILLTGMSGTGKSSLIDRLSALGHQAADADDQGWVRQAEDGGWIWREDEVDRFLRTHSSGLLFLSGCAESQVRFYPDFDHIILLRAPAHVLEERLRTRTNNPYGKRPHEMAQILGYLETVEPLLREAADHEVDATAPLSEVLNEVLRIAGADPEASAYEDG